MKKLLILIIEIFIINYTFAQVDHSNWDKLLQKHVTPSGIVNYKGFIKDKASLEKYLEILQLNPPSSNWYDHDIKAYWINAYNAFTIQLIIDNYPVESIMDLKFGNTSAWDYKWIKIGNETITLNQIEHNRLLNVFKDPRIHFAVNCASFSCPILSNEAYKGAELEKQLNRATINFINDKKRNEIQVNSIKISQLFEWYKKDFIKEGSVIDYLNKYSKTKIASDATISYLNYNWKLNNK